MKLSGVRPLGGELLIREYDISGEKPVETHKFYNGSSKSGEPEFLSLCRLHLPTAFKYLYGYIKATPFYPDFDANCHITCSGIGAKLLLLRTRKNRAVIVTTRSQRVDAWRL